MVGAIVLSLPSLSVLAEKSRATNLDYCGMIYTIIKILRSNKLPSMNRSGCRSRGGGWVKSLGLLRWETGLVPHAEFFSTIKKSVDGKK